MCSFISKLKGLMKLQHETPKCVAAMLDGPREPIHLEYML